MSWRINNVTKEKTAVYPTDEQTGFVISPIGKQGDVVYERFKNVLDYVIQPAVKNSEYKLNVFAGTRGDAVD